MSNNANPFHPGLELAETSPRRRWWKRDDVVVALVILAFMAALLLTALWVKGPLLEFLMPRIWE